ncbi:uncharacterized protein LOC132312706 [Cornus florida]|uniref:uncharacterized protein LOC132312706 n=1 Tax=Cornus florida TaxID=4283 RepID=UPI0028A2066E|nr:uncharacterized protein LOC132312706 [Cornus florida]
MENTNQHFTVNFASNAFKNLVGNVDDAGAAYSAVTALQLDSPGVSSSYLSNSNGSGRKWSVTNGSANLQDGSSLVLGLGCSSRYCTTKSLGKEIEGSSIDLHLRINTHLGNERSPKLKNIFGIPKTVEVERPKLDLELSLSTGAAESDITSVTEGIAPFENNAESRIVTGTVQLVDEGATSFKWKLRHLVPPLHALQSTETTSHFYHVCNHIDPTPVIPNASLTAADIPSRSVGSAPGAINQQQRHNTTRVKTCQFKGCMRGARGASGLCIAHGGGRRCQKTGCQKGAEGKTVFCKAHGGGRRCQFLGCTRSAEGRTDFCIGHGGGRRCSYDGGCIRAARGKSGLCIRHGGGKRCKMETCSKSAEGISGLCISHGGGRRCQYPECKKGAQGSTMFCKAHGGGKRCTFLGCTKGAEGSTPFCKGHGGGKRCTFEGGCAKSVHGGTLFCVNHGGGKRCAAPECTKSARGRTDFCVRHGGGKRCKFEGCGKSAQGSTDFCKAHGGGKWCSWGRLGSEFGAQAAAPCDKIARGKSGLCAFHNTQVQDKQIHGGGLMGPILQDPQSSTLQKMKGIVTAGNNSIDGIGGVSIDTRISMQIPSRENFAAENGGLVQFSLPEGRVHGGGLMAMLRGSPSFVASNNNQVAGGLSEKGKSYTMPLGWM